MMRNIYKINTWNKSIWNNFRVKCFFICVRLYDNEGRNLSVISGFHMHFAIFTRFVRRSRSTETRWSHPACKNSLGISWMCLHPKARNNTPANKKLGPYTVTPITQRVGNSSPAPRGHRSSGASPVWILTITTKNKRDYSQQQMAVARDEGDASRLTMVVMMMLSLSCIFIAVRFHKACGSLLAVVSGPSSRLDTQLLIVTAHQMTELLTIAFGKLYWNKDRV